MKFYLLGNEHKQSQWQSSYEALYTRELRKLNQEVYTITNSDIHTVKADDYLWIMHYNDLNNCLLDCNGTVITQSNGTSANQYTTYVNNEEEKYQMDKLIDICLVYNNRHKYEMELLFKNTIFLPTGFPVEVQEVKPRNKKKGSIVIAGRMTIAKNTFLSLYLLEKYRKSENFSVELCYNSSKGEEFLLANGGDDFFKRLNVITRRMEHCDFINKLYESEFYFTASLDDTGSVSLTEALLCGCYPIIPKFNTGFPVYDDYVSIGYEPFSKKEIENLIDTKPKFTWSYTQSDPKLCADRLMRYLSERSV